LADVRDVVVIVSVTVGEPASGVIEAEGANEAVASWGGAVAASVMGFVNVPLEGATVRLKTADCPAVTVTEDGGPAIV
jgi:hypothetical protein